MNSTSLLCQIIGGILCLAVGAPVSQAAPSEAKAFFREGQTFLTWQEDAAANGEWYLVYASSNPITVENLDQAKRIAKIPEGSRKFQFLRNVDVEKQQFYRDLMKEPWYAAIQIEDDEHGAKQFPEGTGLFVLTIHARGRPITPSRWNATARRIGRRLRRPLLPSMSRCRLPGAVMQRKLDDRHYLYAYFCDYEIWNPDGIEDNWEGYVHVFQIRAPAAGTKGTQEPYPAAFRLHAYGAWKDWNIKYCWPGTHINVRLLDYHLCWWYGYNDHLPRLAPDGRSTMPGPVVNFSERRVMQVARWLASGPKHFPFKVDPERFCVLGGSMGGTGTHLIGARNGDVFAAAFADEGIWNWAMEARWVNWTSNVVSKFGPRDRKDPTPDNIPVYESINQEKQAAEHPERELPFFDIGQAIIDYVIPFHDVDKFWKGMEKGKHPYAACWDMVGHVPWCGPASAMDYQLIRKDEVLPAFANASCNTRLGSGFRIVARHDGLTAKTLTIKPGSLAVKEKGQDDQNDHLDGSFPDLKGKTLVLGPSAVTRTFFRIASNTPTQLTIADGDLLAYEPPLTSWDVQVLKGELKKQGDANQEPTDGEKKARAESKKKEFLICDGEPRGTWNGHFQWSTKNQNFDPKRHEDDIVDEVKKFGINLRVTTNRFSTWDGEYATADVTPRRCRNFKPMPNEKVRWENWSFADPAAPKKLTEGEVAADANGLVTVPGFVIGKAGLGNRLVLLRK